MVTQQSILEGHEKAIERAVNKLNLPQENKNIRQPVNADPKQIERDMKTALPLDREGEFNYLSQLYMSKYPDKKLFWVNSNDPLKDRWIDRDAEPIPTVTRGKREYAGITTKDGAADWVCIRGVSMIDGHSIDAYLFMIDPELWDHYKLAPDRERNAALRQRMYSGQADPTARGQGNELQTYAPNIDSLPVKGSGQGFSEQKQ